METLIETSVAQIGGNVGIEYGTKLVKDYFDTYPEQAYGHIIGRRIIDKILAQPGCQGLTIYPALNEDRREAREGYRSRYGRISPRRPGARLRLVITTRIKKQPDNPGCFYFSGVAH